MPQASPEPTFADKFQHTTGRPSHALKSSNTARCVAATFAILGLSGGLHATENSRKTTSENAPALNASIATTDALPSAAEAIATFHKVESWVHSWSVPADTDGLPSVTAVAVALRLDGSLIGRGSAVTTRSEGDPGVIRSAVQHALDEAASRMPVERDALFEDSLRHMAPSLTISLELAGELIPFEPREYADVSLSISPGLEGVAVRMGQRMDALLPGTMLANATEPGSALAAVVSRLSGDPALGLKAPGKLAEEHDAVFYRFRTIHLAQPRAGIPPIFLHRGGRILERGILTSGGLHQWASGMADHLIARATHRQHVIRTGGTYHPTTGISEPVFAGPAEQALAALALIQYSETSFVSGSRSLEVRAVAEDLLRNLAAAEGGERDPITSPAAVAASWVSLRALSIERPGSGSPTMRTDHEQLVDFFARLNNAMDRWERDITQLPASQRAIATWALARRAVEGRKRVSAVENAVRTLYRETPPGHLVTHMPWLGWAEVTLARFEEEPGVRSDIPAAIALREMREQVWNHQLTTDDLPFESRDLAGGILFTASRNPLPTWHSARPLAFIATMLGDDRLTGNEEVPAELSRLLGSLRFLRQLSAGEAEGHMYRSPQTAMWGTRSSVWDQRMPPEATAITLLTVCEVLRSLQEVQARQ